jgi:hypothetical protein
MTAELSWKASRGGRRDLRSACRMILTDARRLWPGILPIAIVSCSRSSAPKTAQVIPLEITAAGEFEDFHDLQFAIQKYETLADGTQVIHAVGAHHGREVGLDLTLGPGWKSSQIVPGVTSDQGLVTYRSNGAESDAFLQVLDEIYETKVHPAAMRTETQWSGISLKGDPGALDKGPTKIKLFFESNNADEYAELFTNIDLAARILQIHEKDPEYRPAIIHALATR